MRPIALLALSVAFLPPLPAFSATTADNDLAAARADPAASVGRTTNAHFMKRHAEILEQAKESHARLVFLGDSITELWSTVPDLWNRRFGSYLPANFGVGSDLTQNVIWRIDHGELDGISPKVIVLLIGTNNTLFDTAPQIVAGIKGVLERIHSRQPQTHVLLVGILPRGPRWQAYNKTYDDGVERMREIRAVNQVLPSLADGKNVRFVDVSSRFLGPDGKLRSDMLNENIHPNAIGYAAIADGIGPILEEMMR